MPIRAGFGLYDLLPLPYLMENRTNSFSVLRGRYHQRAAGQRISDRRPRAHHAEAVCARRTSNKIRAAPIRRSGNLVIQRQLAGHGVADDRLRRVAGLQPPAQHRGRQPGAAVAHHHVRRRPSGLPDQSGAQGRRSDRAHQPELQPHRGDGVWDDFSNYNSLIVDFNRQFSHGLFFKTAYTWAKSMDGGSNTFSDNESTNTSGSPYAFIPGLQRGVSDFDIAHRFVMSFSWQIPSPSSTSRASQMLLSGWSSAGSSPRRAARPSPSR